MENRAYRNPVLAHLTRNTRWPTVRATLWLAAGLMLTSLTLTVFLLARVEEYHAVFRPVDILTLAAWGLHLVMPMVAAPLAAILTVRETQDESFQLLRVTPGYSPGGAVRGLVLATLYHLRVPLVLMVAMAPMVIVEPFRWPKPLASEDCYVFVSREEWYENYGDGFTDTGDLTCIGPWDRRLLLRSLMTLLWPVGLWGATLFSAALAVWLALWWGRVGWVWAYLVGWPLCVVVVLTLLRPAVAVPLRTYVAMLLKEPYTRFIVMAWPPSEFEGVVLFSVLFSVVFYMLAWGVMRLARRWA